jgi:hypothetical protein
VDGQVVVAGIVSLFLLRNRGLLLRASQEPLNHPHGPGKQWANYEVLQIRRDITLFASIIQLEMS